MFDTIRVTTSLPVLQDREEELKQNESSAWVNRSEQLFHSFTKEWIDNINAHHRDSGFNATVKNGTLIQARASLPRLIHGSNGIQIKSADDLERSLDAFLAHLRFLNNGAQASDFKVSGLDLAINLLLDPRKVLPMHRNAKHPIIHRETQEYYNDPPAKLWGKPPHRFNDLNTVRFHGTRTTIVLYDKVREVLKIRRGDWPAYSQCTRVEIQLRNSKHIAKLLGFEDRDFITLDQLDIQTCYRAYRRILLEFDEIGTTPAFEPNFIPMLAILERHPETWKTIGMRPLDWYRTGVSARRFREVRRQVGKLQLERDDFRWADYLPVACMPDIVDIDEDGREHLISNPWSFPVRCLRTGIPGPQID